MMKPAKILMFAILFVLFIFAFGWVVMSLWNWLMPALFGWRLITYWQALGLLVLCKILFGGFRGGRHGGHRHWRERMGERWAQMTPEEREKFMQGVQGRWPCGPAAEKKETPSS